MKKFVVTAALVLFVACAACAQDIVGDWEGTLHAGPADLRLVLHVGKAEGGGFKATLDSVDQAAYGIPVRETSSHTVRAALLPKEVCLTISNLTEIRPIPHSLSRGPT